MREILIVTGLILTCVAVVCFATGFGSVDTMHSEITQAHQRAYVGVILGHVHEDESVPPPPAMPEVPAPLDEIIEPTTGRPWSEIMTLSR